MFSLFKKKTRTFNIEDKEKFLRCWWFANKVTNRILNIFLPTAISSFIDDVRFEEHDRKAIVEIIGYTMSYSTNRLRDDIEATHGWSDNEWELNINYQVFLGQAFDQVFRIKENEEESFVDLLQDYYSPEYNDDYENFWSITYDDYPDPEDVEDPNEKDIPEIQSAEQAIEILGEIVITALIPSQHHRYRRVPLPPIL